MKSAYWGYANNSYDSQEHVFMIFNPVKTLVWAPAPPPQKKLDFLYIESIEDMSRDQNIEIRGCLKKLPINKNT